MSSPIERAIESLKNVERTILNAVWREGGMDAVEDIETKIRSCEHCGHVADEPFVECPICGKRN